MSVDENHALLKNKTIVALSLKASLKNSEALPLISSVPS